MRKLAFLILVGATLAVSPVVTSCGSWRSTTHKTVGSVAISGDAAMKSWAAYVHTGKATTNQEAQVKLAYERYQASMNAIIDVGKSVTTSTNKAGIEKIAQAAVAAQANLVKTIQSFTK